MRARSYHASPGACHVSVLCISLWMISVNMLVNHCIAVDGRSCGKVDNRGDITPHQSHGPSVVHRRSAAPTGELCRLLFLAPAGVSQHAFRASALWAAAVWRCRDKAPPAIYGPFRRHGTPTGHPPTPGRHAGTRQRQQEANAVRCRAHCGRSRTRRSSVLSSGRSDSGRPVGCVGLCPSACAFPLDASALVADPYGYVGGFQGLVHDGGQVVPD
jgi:hypothetical protein